MGYRSEGQLYPGYTYLTPRQAEVLRLSFKGLDNRSIAVRLDLSYERVRQVKQTIRYKAARGAARQGRSGVEPHKERQSIMCRLWSTG